MSLRTALFPGVLAILLVGAAGAQMDMSDERQVPSATGR